MKPPETPATEQPPVSLQATPPARALLFARETGVASFFTSRPASPCPQSKRTDYMDVAK